jgi:hypothetical protein
MVTTSMGGWPAHEAKYPHSSSAGLQRPRYVNLASTHFLPPARAARHPDGHLDAIDTPVRSAMVPVATQLQTARGCSHNVDAGKGSPNRP